MAVDTTTGEAKQQLRAYVDYLRDMGIHDLYRQGEPVYAEIAPVPPAVSELAAVSHAVPKTAPLLPTPLASVPAPVRPAFLEPPIPTLISFNELAPLPETRTPATEKAGALLDLQKEIGDCTRCPLAYAGRRTIVFADGDPNARLMFVGEAPGADEDTSGIPFVGKAGQLLNNMIQAMGLKREQVYIANIVKCRPPNNRVPEPVEAQTCDPFLLRQIDIVQPEFIVALGATAAMYLLGVKQSLASLRGRWHSCRGAKLAITYHPAFLLRDPRQKGEAWKDLQMVMAEMGLKPPAKP
jgi:uracil-DNA glycosylase family 4